MMVFSLLVVELRSGIGLTGLDFYFIAVGDELGSESERFPLQDQVDEVHGLARLIVAIAVGNLSGVKLE